MARENEKPAFIYGIRSRVNADPFYVGSTIKTIEERFNQHISQVRRRSHCNSGFTQQAHIEGLDNCIVECLEETVESQRFNREYHWIQTLRSRGVSLTNIVASAEHGWHIKLSRIARETELEHFAFSNHVRHQVRMWKAWLEGRVSHEARWQGWCSEYYEELKDQFVDNPQKHIKRWGFDGYQSGLEVIYAHNLQDVLDVPKALMVVNHA